MPNPSKTPVAARKAALVAQQAAIGARLATIGNELASHQNPDWEDLAAEREGDEVLEAEGLAGQHDLRQIEAALQRIDHGDYGTCVKCGTAIAEHRLDILPATPFCSTCAT